MVDESAASIFESIALFDWPTKIVQERPAFVNSGSLPYRREFCQKASAVFRIRKSFRHINLCFYFCGLGSIANWLM